MEFRPGIRVRVRGLTWDVFEVDRAGNCQRLSLRCSEGDMAGLEWEVYVPPEQVELVQVTFDPQSPGPLSLWHLMHRAHLLNELPDETSFVAREPGRIRVEPYQLVPLMRALDMPRPRLLLADGVGLGKTVQALLIATELIARRRAHRILIVAPSGPLLWQWEQETRLRFGLKFTLVTNAAEMWEVRRTHELGANPFDAVSRCITAFDFAKQDHVLEDLERSAWDLVIIDEAHHCAGFGSDMSRDNTYRRKLAEALASRSDGLLLLTATPHDGHEAHFASLIALLDPSLVNGAGGLVGYDYRRHVIRRMKVHIRDPRTGTPLFRPRHVLSVKVDVNGAEQERVREFHRALSAFVVPRLRRRPGADDALAFVSLLKRSVSTIAACLETLRVVADRLARSASGDVETRAARRERTRALHGWRRRVARFGTLATAEEANQAMLEIESMTESLRAEPDDELTRLISLGVTAVADDPKLSAMILEVRLIRIGHRRANILIYTEYTDSQIAAARALRSALGIEGDILTIGGEDDNQARADAARRFSESDDLILISTDSLAEGLNLHRHCFHLIHLDLPYNPNRLEQRNGRIDRYGQQNEPRIRYLYIAGTFEENLLLHLIAKYEKARASLDVMPDTLGVTAERDDYESPLTGMLSENPDSLFKADAETIRSLDRAVVDSSPGVVAELMHEIDHAYDTFELMAVSHGWYGPRGINAGLEALRQAERSRSANRHREDLPAFIGAVISTETNTPAIDQNDLRVPMTWTQGLDGLPGFDSDTGVLRFTHDFDAYHDATGRGTGFVGRAHPLALRAIRHGCRLPGAVAVGRGDDLGLLLTYELEFSVLSRTAFREVIAVMARPDRSPVEYDEWLALGDPEHAIFINDAWQRLFAFWAGQARLESGLLVERIASRRHQAVVARQDRSSREEIERMRRWLRVRADLLCGTFVHPMGDLFGGSEPGPVWRFQKDPSARLVSFATDPEVPGSKRHMANEVIKAFTAMRPSDSPLASIVCRPIGMLMLVPRNEF